jgi:hypothetical protein
MILTKEILVGINYLNINHYKNLGYDVKFNNKILIPIEYLQLESNLKIIVVCDVCNKEKIISYQKYNKNIKKYNLYTCSVICSQQKIKYTNKIKYGCENYVNVEKIKKTIKEKYDEITKQNEIKGQINCIKCLENKKLNDFLIKNGRYKHICKKCRTKINSDNRRKRFLTNPELEKSKQRNNYLKNIHIHAWRNILKNYLNRKKLLKNDKTYNMLKYSPNDLKLHLEKLFKSNMSWENYGEWQIDHIVHVSFFKDDTPFYIVNCLENLRPLFNNSERGNKIDADCLNLMTKFENYLKYDYIKNKK